VKEDNVPAAIRALRQVPRASDAGKETEVENLFRNYNQLVFRTAYRVTGSTVDAEDVLQTVFLRLIAREEEPDLSPSPASCLHRAAINASLDILRARSRAKSQPIGAAEDSIHSPGRGPDATYADAELRAQIRQSISRLGDKAAQVVVLRYFEGYGNREIAEMLGTSHLVVGVILHRARARLRSEIRKFVGGT
jgi:RNA polymerase sigma factor (sigma-70 family)